MKDCRTCWWTISVADSEEEALQDEDPIFCYWDIGEYIGSPAEAETCPWYEHSDQYPRS